MIRQIDFRKLRVSQRGLRIVGVALVTVWLLVAITVLAFVQLVQTDFAVFYAAAATLREHTGSIYDIATITTTMQRHSITAHFPHPAYLYPPLLAIVLIPIVALPYAVALQVWTAVELALWAGSAALVVLWLRQLWRPGAETLVIGLAFGLLCWPLASGIAQFAQLDALVLVCLLLAPWLIVHNRPGWGGALLAIVAMIKIIPALLIVFYLLRGRWRVVRGALICGAVLLVCQALVVGPSELLAMRDITSTSNLFVGQADNFSLLHFPVWLAIAIGIPVSPSLSLPGMVLVAMVAVAFVVGVAITFTHSQGSPINQHDDETMQADLLGYGWAVCTMLLMTPLVWLHYLGWLLIPLILCGGLVLGRQRTRRDSELLALLVLGYVMATVRLPLLYDTTPQYSLAPFLGPVALRPFAMVLHPLGEVVMWIVTGTLFAHASGISRLRLTRDTFLQVRVKLLLPTR